MKKNILWILLYLLLGFAAVAYGAWGDYTAFTTGQLDDLDDVLIRDVSEGANGVLKRWSWSVIKEDIKSSLPLSKSFNFNGLSTADDFLIYRAKRALTVTSIEGILDSGTNVVGTFHECDSTGASCSAIEANITFDGGLDTDAGGIDAPTIELGNTIKWITVTVSAPGKLWAQINFN